MVRSRTPESVDRDQTLGDLVALATKDVSQLVRYEINLAKSELRGDVRRVAVAGVLAGIAGFFVCLILFSLCFAYAYLLHWAGAWGGMGGAFGFVALTLLVLMLLALLVAWLTLRHLTKMRKTRQSVSEGISMLKRKDESKDEKGAADAEIGSTQHPEISGSKPA
jgi:ABC-type multidrug transport system fused ATPase/permease subunit